MDLYITSNCAVDKSIGAAVKHLVSAGYKRIELSGGTDASQFCEDDILSLHESGVDFLVHHYFPPPLVPFVMNISSNVPEIKARTFELIDQALVFSKRLGKSHYSIHAGYALDQIPKMTKAKIFQQVHTAPPIRAEAFYSNLVELSARIPDGFRIAIENGTPLTMSHLSTPDHFFRFLEFVQERPNLGLLIDLAHLRISAEHHKFSCEKLLEQLVSQYSNHILELHVSANDGKVDSHDVCAPDSCEINFLFENKDALKGVPVVMEWHAALGAKARGVFEKIESLLT